MLVPLPASLPSNQHYDRRPGLKAVLYRTLRLTLVIFIGLLCTHSDIAFADGGAPPASPSATALTGFESFILTDCAPCVREHYFIGTVPIPSIKAPTFSGAPPLNAATNTRAGELRFELLRAYPLGLDRREHFAMRVVISSPGAGGVMYPLAAGLLDEDEIPVLADALSQMGKSMGPGAADSSIQLVDTEIHADSVRMGTVRTGNDVFAYVQVAPPDLPRFALKQVWEVPTMYLASKDIPTLEQSVMQVSAKIRAIRGR